MSETSCSGLPVQLNSPQSTIDASSSIDRDTESAGQLTATVLDLLTSDSSTDGSYGGPSSVASASPACSFKGHQDVWPQPKSNHRAHRHVRGGRGHGRIAQGKPRSSRDSEASEAARVPEADRTREAVRSAAQHLAACDPNDPDSVKAAIARAAAALWPGPLPAIQDGGSPVLQTLQMQKAALSRRLALDEKEWEHSADKRFRDIEKVKSLPEYYKYSVVVPRDLRLDDDPRTPDPTNRHNSKRGWKRQVLEWQAAVRAWKPQPWHQQPPQQKAAALSEDGSTGCDLNCEQVFMKASEWPTLTAGSPAARRSYTV